MQYNAEQVGDEVTSGERGRPLMDTCVCVCVCCDTNRHHTDRHRRQRRDTREEMAKSEDQLEVDNI